MPLISRLDALLDLASGRVACMPVLPQDAVRPDAVPPFGPSDAIICVVGEAPGHEEVAQGRPFCGRSGRLLRHYIRRAGLSPSDIYYDNVYPCYPPAGKIANVDHAELETEGTRLCMRLRTLPDLRLIVPVGNTALKALLGFDQITKHRGSMYEWEGRKVIPTIHPSAILHGQSSWQRRCMLDWERIAREARTAACIRLVRHHETNPTTHYAEDFYNRAALAHYLALDIETKPSEGRILCVGFSIDPKESMILTWDVEWHRYWIEMLCALHTTKVLWHHQYDRVWLTNFGVPLGSAIIDGMGVLHTLWPTDNVALAYAASLYTDEPFWKDTKKEEDDRTADENWERFKIYCGTDVATTLEITQTLLSQLDQAGLTDFHQRHYQDLYDPIHDLMVQGVRIDHAARCAMRQDYITKANTARDALEAFTGGAPLFSLTTHRDRAVFDCVRRGEDPFDLPHYTAEQVARSLQTIADKTVSVQKLKDLLYGRYGLPITWKRRDSGEETETMDIFTLRKLRYDYRDHVEVNRIIDLAIEHTRMRKLASFIAEDKFDTDGRFRFTLKLETETGRLASSTAPNGRRNNSQNIPRNKPGESAIRDLFLPEEGHVILQCDYSAAEARICFAYTGDLELIALARKRADVYDQHRHTAVIVGFAPSYDETPENFAAITGAQRQVSKSIGHGAQRNLQAETLAQTLLRDDHRNRNGALFSVEECQTILDRYHRRFPAIRQVLKRVARDARRAKRLVNSWGRVWPIPYEPVSDELDRRAASWLWQSENADNLNQLGFKALWYWLRDHRMQSRILLQEHDGLVISAHPDEAYDVAVFLRDSLEQEREYGGVALAIPVEFCVGRSWGDKGTEWKTLPEREEFEKAVKTSLVLL